MPTNGSAKPKMAHKPDRGIRARRPRSQRSCRRCAIPLRGIKRGCAAAGPRSRPCCAHVGQNRPLPDRQRSRAHRVLRDGPDAPPGGAYHRRRAGLRCRLPCRCRLWRLVLPMLPGSASKITARLQRVVMVIVKDVSGSACAINKFEEEVPLHRQEVHGSSPCAPPPYRPRTRKAE
jgi:hypothetical protein